MPVKPRKIPMRMCVGCREMKPKAQLLRVVRPQEGEVRIDRTGKAPWRGAYVCDRIECLRKAQKSRALERARQATRPPVVVSMPTTLSPSTRMRRTSAWRSVRLGQSSTAWRMSSC